MAITPIDLQTIFTQVDKVGRAQVAQKEGQTLSQSIQGNEIQRKTDENIRQVNEAQDLGDGTDKIRDREKKKEDSSNKEKKQKDEEEEKEKNKSVLRDPALGNKIDISL
ncbi:MAG: hypothetical protein FWD24_08145 [Treponema sp.]|nr:hypothetical protein [Treponema sp.]